MQSQTENLEHNILLHEDIENVSPLYNAERKSYIKRRLKYKSIINSGCCFSTSNCYSTSFGVYVYNTASS